MNTATLHIPLRELNPDALRDLQEKYPGAEVSVTLGKEETFRRMSESEFWEIINALDWSQEKQGDAAVIAPAIDRLAALPIHSLYDFKNILAEKLYLLDTVRHAQNIGEEAWQADKYFSVDNFLYARCCVVANGKAYYEQVLKNPEDMPKEVTFEALLRIPGEAYQKKTGKRLVFVTTYSYETYSNREGWEVV